MQRSSPAAERCRQGSCSYHRAGAGLAAPPCDASRARRGSAPCAARARARSQPPQRAGNVCPRQQTPPCPGVGPLRALQIDLLSSDNAHEPLVDWLSSQGVDASKQASLPVRLERQGVVLATRRAVPSGQRLVSIPESAWITPETVARSTIGPAVARLEPWLRLALFLLHERRQQNSRWRPYLDALPAEPASPVFWSDVELAELEGSPVLQSVEGYRRFFEGKFAELEAGVFAGDRTLFPESGFGYAAFLWAVGCVRARVHTPLEGSKVALVPVADLVTHRRGAAAGWALSGGLLAGPRAAGILAMRNVRAGELVCMDFGTDQLDSELLLNYGVVDTETAQAGFMVTLDIPESDRYYDDKVDVLEVAGQPAQRQFVLRADTEPSDELLGYLRLINLQGADCFLLESLFRNEAWGHMLKPVSEANEAAVFQSMTQAAAAALQAYPTPVDADLLALREAAPGSRRAAAIWVRLGEKEVLDATLRFFEARSGRLGDLEFYQERRLKGLGLLDEDANSTYDAFFRDGIA